MIGPVEIARIMPDPVPGHEGEGARKRKGLSGAQLLNSLR